jgi:hypothetical protein
VKLRVIVFSLVALVFLLGLSGIALAATPEDIYNDFAADGDLDRSYTDAELEAYLNDATVHQYGSAAVLSTLDDLVEQLLAGTTPAGRSSFPFTGFEIFLAGIGGLALIGGGIAVRRTVG